MAVMRWDPFREMTNMQEQFDRMFGSFLGRGNGGRWLPTVDVFDGRDEVPLKADLPGVHPDDVSVELDENVLSIRGERRPEQVPDEERFYRLERPAGSFERSIALPQGVLPDDVRASFEDGVLTVRVPKAEEVKPKRIQIDVQGHQPRTIETKAEPHEKKAA